MIQDEGAASTPVVTAADGQYLPYLAVFLASLAANAGPSVNTCIVLFRDIDETSRRLMTDLLTPPRTVRWVEVTEELCREVGAPLALACAPANYFRLLTPYLCPTDRRALYFDADTLVMGDIAPLIRMELLGHAAAAVVDWLATVKEAISNWAELGLDAEAPYFNTGVMMLDLESWRRQNLAARAFEICASHAGHLLAQGRWPQHEQYGVNVALAGDWAPLERKWNHFSEIAVEGERPRVVHFLGQGKPTSQKCQRDLAGVFFDTLSRTPWRGAISES